MLKFYTGFKLRGSNDKEKSLPSAREVGKVIRSHLQKPSVTALLSEFSHFIASDSFSIPVRSMKNLQKLLKNLY